ncbi:protein of unknown function [Burkholderia multivorans]
MAPADRPSPFQRFRRRHPAAGHAHFLDPPRRSRAPQRPRIPLFPAQFYFRNRLYRCSSGRMNAAPDERAYKFRITTLMIRHC